MYQAVIVTMNNGIESYETYGNVKTQKDVLDKVVILKSQNVTGYPFKKIHIFSGWEGSGKAWAFIKI